MGREIQWDVLKQPDFEKRKQKEERKEKRRQRMSEIWASVGYFLATFAIFCMISLTIDLVKWVTAHWAEVFAVSLVVGIIALIYAGNRSMPHVKSGRDYEFWCSKYLLRHGFRSAHVTPGSQDYGADIVARDRRWRLWVVQCKYYSRNVGVSAVQEVVAARAHYSADYAAVMTNAGFTQNAAVLAQENDVKLWSNCI